MANDTISVEGSLGREMLFLVTGNVDVSAVISPLVTPIAGPYQSTVGKARVVVAGGQYLPT
jgi:hypothetical protein